MYGKIFSQMYDGTLATRGPWQALVTFQQMIGLCDKRGVVDMTAEVLARRSTVPLEIIQIGLVALEQPDPESRSPESEGRRIVRLDEHRSWGWRIVNYGHYRNLRSTEERNDYQRELMRKRRAVSKDVSKVSEFSPSISSKHRHKQKDNPNPTPSASLPADLAVSADLWQAFRDHRKANRAPMTARAESLLAKRLQELVASGQDGAKVVEQSIERGWKGLFAVDGGKPAGKATARAATNAAIWGKTTGRDDVAIDGTAERVG